MLKTRLVKHLPYLIFGASQTEQEKLLDPFALLDLDPVVFDGFDDQSAMGAYRGDMEESQLLSSVYFDSPDAVSYQERIRREEGARLLRFRWYGENNMEPDKDIYIERKIHHEGWGSDQSAKERSILPQKVVSDYMSGKFDIDAFYEQMAREGAVSDKARKAMKSICVEVDDMIQQKKLQPIIRTSYYRCAFQLATDNKVRISLDTQMSLLNEFREGRQGSDAWCLTSSDRLSKDEIYRFPFAILEIKLQNVSETPLWLRQTLADVGAVQVHKFSKFQHAMAFLHPERVPILPHWHQDFKEWHEKRDTRTQSCHESISEMYEDNIPELRSAAAPHGEGHQMKDMTNLDPKGIFASERTLLHYAEKGMYAGALAVVLCHQDARASKIAGVALAIGVALFYCWALMEYFSRLDRIVGRAKVGKNTQLRLDWAHGPLLAGALIVAVVSITLLQAWIRNPKEG